MQKGRALLRKGEQTSKQMNPEAEQRDEESRTGEPAEWLGRAWGARGCGHCEMEMERGFKGVSYESLTEASLGSCCENLVKI